MENVPITLTKQQLAHIIHDQEEEILILVNQVLFEKAKNAKLNIDWTNKVRRIREFVSTN